MPYTMHFPTGESSTISDEEYARDPWAVNEHQSHGVTFTYVAAPAAAALPPAPPPAGDPAGPLALLGLGSLSTTLRNLALGGLGGLLGLVAGGGDGGGGEAPALPGLGFTPTGPGVPEPPQAMVAKQWHRLVQSNQPGYASYFIYFFRLIDGRTVCYNPRTRTWKVWRDYKSIVIGKSLTTKNVMAVSSRLTSHVRALNRVLVIIRPKARRK